MKTFKRIRTALVISLRGLGRRWWASLNSVFGTAVVVAVMVAILAIGAGYSEAMKMAEVDDAYMILKGGVRSEMESTLEGPDVRLIESELGGDAAAEVYVVTSIEDSEGEPVNVALRGIGAGSVDIRPGWTLSAGRMPREGRREIVVGKRAQQHFGGLALGDAIRLGSASWTVVGMFETGGSLTESEIWAGATPVQDAFDRPDAYQVVIATPQDGESPQDMQARINRDDRLSVSVVSMADYYGEQARAMERFVSILGYGIGSLMALGAIFAALNTGLGHIKTRAKEIATLSILGWTRSSLTVALAIETVLMTVLGGLIGVALVHLIFDDRLISTLFFAEDFTQIVFDFEVTAAILWQAVAMAVVIGLLGSIGPAMQLRRLPVAQILLQRR
ncbi:ABC transporter permease [Roseivivax sediminis]|uniref:Putative ABC transport system permease protein n=1 Tax=Roseivivax sediminis TaxID=936889 RepID=A0A1I1WF82_9RHOB|nr:ABC transporter permease [Roseivivax sediminis]SFD92063.1 putative ABC transport system permease protein [Roseivivax sediminis]